MKWKRQPLVNTRTLLLEELKDLGNKKAWMEFMETYAGYIEAIAEAPVGETWLRPQEIADVVSKVVVSFAKGIEKYDRSRGSFRGWLKVITNSNKINVLRTRKPDDDARRRHKPPALSQEKDRTSTIAGLPETHPTSLEEIEEAEWQNAVFTRAIQLLRAEHKSISDQQINIIIALRREEKTPAEICAQLGVNAQQVYNAQKRLGDLLVVYGKLAIEQLENPVFPPRLTA